MIGNNPTFVIAEAGVNHNGSLDLALKLVEAAMAAGADAVKFQTFRAENVVTASAESPAYQKRDFDTGPSQFELLKSLELPYSAFGQLKAHCDQVGIRFMSTADDSEALSIVDPLVEVLKVGSAELTDWPFLKRVAGLGKPVIVSTGMADFDEVRGALAILCDGGLDRGNIILLHCNTAYPTPYTDVNLRAMAAMGQDLGVRVGYSDHTLGIEIPIAAVAMGACVIEKHFTLDRTLPGPDHATSLNPGEFASMVAAIRHVESAMGDGLKKRTPSEAENFMLVRKSIVARVHIRTGEVITEEKICVKRPGFGLSPTRWSDVLGRVATRDYEVDDPIQI